MVHTMFIDFSAELMGKILFGFDVLLFSYFLQYLKDDLQVFIIIGLTLELKDISSITVIFRTDQSVQ